MGITFTSIKGIRNIMYHACYVNFPDYAEEANENYMSL